MADDASSRKFLVSNFINYKMTDSRPVMEQYNELLDFKHTLKHKKEELTLVELVSHLRIKESLRVQDSDKLKNNNVVSPSAINMCGKPGHFKKDCKGEKVGNKTNDSGTNGSMNGSSNSLKGNKKYFVTFIDDAFRSCYVYLLHTKNEALDKFKVFKTEVELQQGSLFKRFKFDRGGEYMDTLYFQLVGIIHETTTPYTPQQNGISKRKDRVLKV
ncbi:zinc finger, CCHC-type containing protein [Tanacetum coccineum]